MTDYKEKYEKAVQAAMLAKQDTESAVTIGILETIFPELKESDGARAKREIIDFLKCCCEKEVIKAIDAANWIAWLEKQGEQKPADFSDLRTWKYIVDAVWTEKEGIGQYLDSPFTEEVAKKLQKRFGNVEQKPDKVEPKFHKGEWVVYDHRAYQVVELPKEGYINLGLRRNGKIEFAPSTYCRPWTIEDAKDGDVLASKDGDDILIFRNIEDNVCFSSYYNIARKTEHYWLRSSFIPATKEQRDLLFQKMKEAGYEWNADTKELKKIEQKPAEWSEYDNEMFLHCCAAIRVADYSSIDDRNMMEKWFRNLKDRVQPQPKQEWSEEDEKYWSIVIAEFSKCAGKSVSKDEWMRCNDWLNSLRDRVQPQPKQEWSEEDRGNLLDVKCIIDEVWHNQYVREEIERSGEELESLWHWLDKLWQRVEYPQSTWKPSDAQMASITCSVRNMKESACYDSELVSLYQELKKLREE